MCEKGFCVVIIKQNKYSDHCFICSVSSPTYRCVPKNIEPSFNIIKFICLSGAVSILSMLEQKTLMPIGVGSKSGNDRGLWVYFCVVVHKSGAQCGQLTLSGTEQWRHNEPRIWNRKSSFYKINTIYNRIDALSAVLSAVNQVFIGPWIFFPPMQYLECPPLELVTDEWEQTNLISQLLTCVSSRRFSI